MILRIVDIVLVYTPTVAYTVKLLAQRGNKEKAVVIALLVCSLYWALMYVLQQSWPSLDTLAELAFDKPTQALLRLLK